tara:strand:- start:503 stop:874 length:372 start_codon:yes stop_codon:yes gene_type:complete
MNKKNIFLTVIVSAAMFTTFTHAAQQGLQLKDLGMDGEARMYDVVCPSGKITTLVQPVGPALEEDVEPLPEDAEIIELKSDTNLSFTAEEKPRVCTVQGDGEEVCERYKDINAAAEAVCKQLG